VPKLLLTLLCGLSLFFSSQSIASPIKITIVTEDAYPLQYVEDGRFVGPAYDIVKQVLDNAQLDYQLQVVPWARAYAIATKQPNTLIFSIARTEQREPLFHWIGELMELDYYFYGLAGNFITLPLDEADLKRKRIGTIIDSATYQFLMKSGYQRLYPVTSARQNFEKLLSGRIDMFPANRPSFELSCQKFQKDCSYLRELMPVGLPPSKLYFAMSRNSSDEIVIRVKNAYQQYLLEKQQLNQPR